MLFRGKLSFIFGPFDWGKNSYTMKSQFVNIDIQTLNFRGCSRIYFRYENLIFLRKIGIRISLVTWPHVVEILLCSRSIATLFKRGLVTATLLLN